MSLYDLGKRSKMNEAVGLWYFLQADILLQ